MAIAKQLGKQTGFTLIELVTVIVILGILASFALPKFVALDARARVASLRGLEGSVRSASALAHSLALASGATGATGTISVEGQTVNVAFGYPTVDDIDDMLQSYDGYTLSATSTVATFASSGTSDTNCKVTYTPPTAAGNAPAVALGSASPTCN